MDGVAIPGGRGVLTVEALTAAVGRGDIDVVVCAFADGYGRLLGKRLDADYFVEHALAAGTHACDYLLTVDLEMEPVAGYEIANWDLGYGDMHLVPDLSTLRLAAWSQRTAWVICDLTHEQPAGEERPINVAPRQILRRQLERCGDLRPHGASELEFFMYEESYRAAAAAAYRDLSPSGWYIEDYHLLQGARVEPFVGEVRRALRDSGVPVESSKGEWGRGQHEINIAYCELLEMADRHTLMKHAMKEMAEQHGISLTFMAKPHSNEAGSSCHVHLSLWRDGHNVFTAGDQPSELFRWFLGGWISHVHELMPFYAPTVNSYKRYREGSWAPTATAWSRDNRTTGFRVVGEQDSLRIECRIPGADANPYLLFASIIASGMDGIERRIEPPPPHDGDAYRASHLRALPRSLEAATDLFASSSFARQAFGDDVVDHYAHFFSSENEAFNRAVSDIELQRYFEQI